MKLVHAAIVAAALAFVPLGGAASAGSGEGAPGGLLGAARRVFACPPLPEAPPPAKGGTRRPKARRHRLDALGLSLRLPRSWAAPVAPTRFAAEAASPDGRTTVRVTVERLDGLTLPDAVAMHEGRTFGPSTASLGCSAALLARYGRDPADAALGVYRSRLSWRGQTTTWALYVRRDDALVTLSVESRWTGRHRPDHGAVDSILAGLRWTAPTQGTAETKGSGGAQPGATRVRKKSSKR